MQLRLAIISAVLLILTACSGSGYNRAYIISDTVDEEVISESAEKR